VCVVCVCVVCVCVVCVCVCGVCVCGVCVYVCYAAFVTIKKGATRGSNKRQTDAGKV